MGGLVPPPLIKKEWFYMRYSINNKTINIPDIDIQRSMKVLGITKDEAIQVWLEDEGYLENEEQIELEKKAKQNKIKHEAKSTSIKKKTQKERVQKEDPEKEQIIQLLFKALQTISENVVVTNKTKLIKFQVGEDSYKIDLIRERKKK